MRLFYKYLIFCLYLATFFGGCKEPFNPPVIVDTHHYLVVEGFINTGQGPTFFTLTRTRNLSDTGVAKNVSGVPDSIFETGATVIVEDQQGNRMPLPELRKGQYGGIQLSLNDQEKYRLYIKTKDGQEYASEFVPVINTPPMGNIVWNVVPGDGLHVGVQVSGSNNDTKYMRWTYSETWEFHSYYQSLYWYDPSDSTLKFRSPQQMVDTCWQTDTSTDILLSTSGQISQNQQKVELIDVPYHSEKASVLYSILVNQMSITKDEYQFWLNMKKNTESLGSIFDPQPFTSTGNIHCITNPSEPVIGYVGAEDVVSNRIFIANGQLPSDWNPTWQNCNLYPVPSDSLWYYYGRGIYYPVDKEDGTFRPCADCTTRGTTTKPSFWP